MPVRKNGTSGAHRDVLSAQHGHEGCLPTLPQPGHVPGGDGAHSESGRAACGVKKTVFKVWVRRVVCATCGASLREPLEFCPGSHVGYTKWLAQYVLALRRHLCISAVAELTGLHWDTVKAIEKKYLAGKYRRVSLKSARLLGIDEVYLGRTLGYITVVRNLESGAVLFVGKGKGGEALEPFKKCLRRRAGQIRAVCIDMSSAYAAWVETVLPQADIVIDHFHLIKLMIERMDGLRRSTMNRLNDEQKRELKGKRFLLLRNHEALKPDAAEDLRRLREHYADLGTASLMKEYLRNIYKIADSTELARKAFMLWCEKAEASAIACLKQMAKTIRRRIEGLVTYWKYNRLTNASQEGFNNKIGWLTRQAYGYTDQEYLHLKIYDLPNTKTTKEI